MLYLCKAFFNRKLPLREHFLLLLRPLDQIQGTTLSFMALSKAVLRAAYPFIRLFKLKDRSRSTKPYSKKELEPFRQAIKRIPIFG